MDAISRQARLQGWRLWKRHKWRLLWINIVWHALSFSMLRWLRIATSFEPWPTWTQTYVLSTDWLYRHTINFRTILHIGFYPACDPNWNWTSLSHHASPENRCLSETGRFLGYSHWYIHHPPSIVLQSGWASLGMISFYKTTRKWTKSNELRKYILHRCIEFIDIKWKIGLVLCICYSSCYPSDQKEHIFSRVSILGEDCSELSEEVWKVWKKS